MFHPTILAAYLYRRNEGQSNPIDACSDVAQFNGLPVATFARFLAAMNIDVDRLSLIA